MSLADDAEETKTDSLIAAGALFALHVFVAMVIGSLFIFVAGAIADPLLEHAPSRLKSVVECGGLLNPVVWVPGVVLGLFVNRFLNRLTSRRDAGCWVWIVGVAWLSLGILGSVRSYEARYAQGCSALQDVFNAFVILNTRRCEGGESTLAGIFFTIPAINSIGYAVGAALALRLRQEGPEQQ
jgi:hypothetical protein